ncbi:hypothetical protein BH11MYX3_BH11MYX3_30080 [soil metagenome]
MALISWIACVVLGRFAGGPLTSDEAAYALIARGMGQWEYRPVGLVTIARIGLMLGGSDLALRLPCALASPLLLVVVAALGRRLGPWTGAGAAAILAGTHTIVLRAPELLNDLPSTTCLVASLFVIVDELDRVYVPRYRLVTVAPLFAAAFYLRYGTAPVIAVIAIAAAAVWHRALWSRPGPAVVCALVFGALLAPFLIYSQRTTGSIGGILTMAGEVSGRRFIGHGLWIYLVSNPFRFYGIAITPVMLAGLAAVARPRLARRRVAGFLGLVALGQVITVGMISHASTRYVFLAMVLLAILGVDLLERCVRALTLRRAGAITAVLACATMVVTMVPLARKRDRGLALMLAAAHAIRDDSGGAPCVVIARATPQVMWYSRCEAIKIAGTSEPIALTAGWRWYAASTPRRPVDAEAIAASSGGVAIALPATGAWRIEPHGE